MKPGDIVQLKSGGPVMTFSHYSDSRAVCVWFEGSTFHTAVVDVAALQPSQVPIKSPGGF